eukprot:2831566-Pyramimonas_sp.AAC.1
MRAKNWIWYVFLLPTSGRRRQFAADPPRQAPLPKRRRCRRCRHGASSARAAASAAAGVGSILDRALHLLRRT